MSKPGLYANIHKKRARIKAGSGEKMRKPGEKGAPTKENFERAAKTAKYKKKKCCLYLNTLKSKRNLQVLQNLVIKLQVLILRN